MTTEGLPAGWQLMLAESEVQAVRHDPADGGRLHIVFSAAQVRQPDAARHPTPVGHAAGVRLVLGGVALSRVTEVAPGGGDATGLGHAIGRVREGRMALPGLSRDSVGWQRGLPLPGAGEAPPGQVLRLELEFAHGTELELQALSWATQVDGPLNVVESMAC